MELSSSSSSSDDDITSISSRPAKGRKRPAAAADVAAASPAAPAAKKKATSSSANDGNGGGGVEEVVHLLDSSSSDSNSDSDDDLGKRSGLSDGPTKGGARSSKSTTMGSGSSNPSTSSSALAGRRANDTAAKNVNNSDNDDSDDSDGLLSMPPMFPSNSAVNASGAVAAGGGGGARSYMYSSGYGFSRQSSLASNASNYSAASAASSASRSTTTSRSTATATATGSNNGSKRGGKNKKLSPEEKASRKAERDRQRQIARECKARTKQREKEERARLKQLEKEEKARNKKRERDAKAELTKRERAESGKFAAEEICMLVSDSGGNLITESDLNATLDDADDGDGEMEIEGLGGHIMAKMRERGYLTLAEGLVGGGVIGSGNSRSDDMNSHPPIRWDRIPTGSGASCLRWIRRDYLSGGASNPKLAASLPDSDQTVQRMDLVAILFHDPASFIALLERDERAREDDDYPRLREWLTRVRGSLRDGWERRWRNDPESGGGGHAMRFKRGATTAASSASMAASATAAASTAAAAAASVSAASTCSSRLVLILPSVHSELSRQWNRGGARRQSFSPTTEEELNDAIVWLLMEHKVECALPATDTETAEYIADLTRALSEAPYYEDPTELHCVRKIKAHPDANGTELGKVSDTWLRMVRQVPGMSEAKARKMVERYPTAMSLVEAYYDDDEGGEEGDEADKRLLLSDCLVENRRSDKLSECMWRLMTSVDPNELL